jgi:PAS domain-containing protein
MECLGILAQLLWLNCCQKQALLQKYRHHIEEIVSVRTAELINIKKQLNQEIIERQKVEAELQGNQAYYQSLVDVLPLNFYCQNLNGQITFANQAFLSKEFLGILAIAKNPKLNF